MKTSRDRILTTHSGSINRPLAVLEMLRRKENGEDVDPREFAELTSAATRDVIERQLAAGIDVINDGEQERVSFHAYVLGRLTGFERRPKPPGTPAPRAGSREYIAFPDFYADKARGASPEGGRLDGGHCVGPIKYRGLEAVKADIERIRSFIAGRPHEEVFICAIAPSYIATTIPNEYYKSHEEYEQAIADALHEEYKAIIDAGVVLQIDDPRLVTYYTFTPGLSIEDCVRWAEQRVDAINYSIRDLPKDRIRFHTCYSIDVGPRVHELELKHIVDTLLRVDAQGLSFEASNPRHEHEYHVFEERRPGPDKVLIPGVITHTTNLVEHPELIAERIERYARIVGRENVIAGNDCGFAAQAVRDYDIHPSVVWAKFEALTEGARLASAKLWRH
ncbi:MAG TPA: cobalamin-independent methionine synthase II family protein [Dehalococcoidia bacterium]|nr:cobalamin-independent methionine synthase II family protein [Dehalococcoidia bacterium]